MAFDEALAARIRTALTPREDVDERRMFGGLAFLIRGNMACGVVGGMLMVRLGDAGAAAALAERHVRPMDFTGRPMRSMVYVEQEGLATDDELHRWVDRAADFALTLPPK